MIVRSYVNVECSLLRKKGLLSKTEASFGRSVILAWLESLIRPVAPAISGLCSASQQEIDDGRW